MSESTLEEFIQIPDDIHQMMHDKMMSDPLIFQELLYQDEISHQKIDPPMWRLKDRVCSLLMTSHADDVFYR